jgi:hypothetical protein
LVHITVMSWMPASVATLKSLMLRVAKRLYYSKFAKDTNSIFLAFYCWIPWPSS